MRFCGRPAESLVHTSSGHNAEKDTLRAFLKDGMMSLQQTEQNKLLKEKQRQARQKRAQVKRDDTALKEQKKLERRKAVLAEVKDESGDSSTSSQQRKIQ